MNLKMLRCSKREQRLVQVLKKFLEKHSRTNYSAIFRRCFSSLVNLDEEENLDVKRLLARRVSTELLVRTIKQIVFKLFSRHVFFGSRHNACQFVRRK
jgi:hypothetical protein